MISVEDVVIGAGFAGAATAYHLIRRGRTDILLLEREAVPGFHSSGRNAAMIRQCVSDPELTQLARDGAAFLRQLPADWPAPVEYKRNGSLLLGSGKGWDKLRHDASVGADLGIGVELWTPEQARARVPVLGDADFDGAVWCATDGVVDIHSLLSGYIKGATRAGARILYDRAVKEIRHAADGGFELSTGAGETIKAKRLINAAGAWANAIAEMAGAAPLPLHPCRRHLFVSPPADWVDVHWPFVWDISHDLYFRPEGRGLLLCACDQQEMPACDPPVDPAVEQSLAEKIQRTLPALARVEIYKRWAGLRTIAGDGRFVIGWDGKVENFFWVAGLGGHGVTTSAAVGALAAELIDAGPGQKSAAFSPVRFFQRA